MNNTLNRIDQAIEICEPLTGKNDLISFQRNLFNILKLTIQDIENDEEYYQQIAPFFVTLCKTIPPIYSSTEKEQLEVKEISHETILEIITLIEEIITSPQQKKEEKSKIEAETEGLPIIDWSDHLDTSKAIFKTIVIILSILKHKIPEELMEIFHYTKNEIDSIKNNYELGNYERELGNLAQTIIDNEIKKIQGHCITGHSPFSHDHMQNLLNKIIVSLSDQYDSITKLRLPQEPLPRELRKTKDIIEYLAPVIDEKSQIKSKIENLLSHIELNEPNSEFARVKTPTKIDSEAIQDLIRQTQNS